MFNGSILTAFSLFLFVMLIFYTFSSEWINIKVYSKKTKSSILINYGFMLGLQRKNAKALFYVNAVNLNMFFVVRKSKENINIFRKINIINKDKKNKKKKFVWNLIRPYSSQSNASTKNLKMSLSKIKIKILKNKINRKFRLWMSELNQQIGKK